MESVKQDEYGEANVSQSYVDEYDSVNVSESNNEYGSENVSESNDMTDREKRIGWMGFTVIVIILVFYYTIELIHFFHR